MKEKIKKTFEYIGDAWRGGWRGKIGLFCMLFAVFGFFRLFVGDVTVQGFIGNMWKLNAEQKQLAAEKENLETVNMHIRLLQEYSPDYVEEVALKYLNIGNPNTRILKN